MIKSKVESYGTDKSLHYIKNYNLYFINYIMFDKQQSKFDSSQNNMIDGNNAKQ